MDERVCRRKNLENGTHVMYSKTENGSEDTLLQGIIEYVEGEKDFAPHGHKARFTNGDIGFVKEILDVDSIDSDHIINFVKLDENQKLEFKATFSVNDETGDVLKCLKDATIKEIAAFMNTFGGIVLIGVSNDKRIIGIERDLKMQKPNPKKNETHEDKFLRSIGDMIDARLKTPILINDYDINLVPIEDNGIKKTVCVINVKKSKDPIFMDMDVSFEVCGENRTKKATKQIFYVRTSDSRTVEVPPRELQNFLATRNIS